MPKIERTDPGAILSKAVEYHGFVYLQGVTAKDTGKDIKGQTADVLAQIDQLLEQHGTDKTRLLQALIWVKNIRDRDGDERGLDAVAAEGRGARTRLRAGGTGQSVDPGRDHGDGLQVVLLGTRDSGANPTPESRNATRRCRSNGEQIGQLGQLSRYGVLSTGCKRRNAPSPRNDQSAWIVSFATLLLAIHRAVA